MRPAGFLSANAVMLAAFSLTVALAACATATPSSSVLARTQQSAEADAAAILKSFAVPPGGHRLARPPSLIGGPRKTPQLADGQTSIRVDAEVSWQPPRPASDLVPAAVRAVTIAQVPGAEAPPGGRLLGPVTITDPARVRALAALVDALPLSLIPPGAPCAMPAGPYLSLTFRARPAGTELAVAETDQNCGTVDLTISGKETPALTQGPAVETGILKLAGLPWKPGTS